MDNTCGPLSVTFLGTGTSTGVPVVACDCPVCRSGDPRDTRLRTSLLVRVKGRVLVIDCGPDFRYQMIRNQIGDIDAIIFTHEHRDHIAGLDDIRGFNYVLNKSLDIYASDIVIEAIHRTFPYIRSDSRFFGAPQVNFHRICNEAFAIGEIDLLPVRVMHDRCEVYGYRIGDLTYITDASYIPPEEKQKIIGSKILIINALRNSKHLSHFCLEEALALIRETGPDEAYLTHMSHFIGLHEAVEKKLPAHVHLAYDNLVLTL